MLGRAHMWIRCISVLSEAVFFSSVLTYERKDELKAKKRSLCSSVFKDAFNHHENSLMIALRNLHCTLASHNCHTRSFRQLANFQIT